MGSFLFRFLKGSLILTMILALLWILNQFKIIDAKNLVLQTAGLFSGLNDLPQTYELGKKQSALLLTREKELRLLEAKLKKSQAKLAADRNALQAAKIQWQKGHPSASTNSTPTLKPTQYINLPTVLKFPPPTSTEKLNNYLNMVGSMKPAQAAVVIQKLPEPIVFVIFEQLPSYQVTSIMEKLPPAYLSTLTQDRLNKYRNL